MALFGELGWTTVSASDEVFGPKGTLQRETKGDLVLVSRLQQSVEDGATLPLFYENRTPELELVNPDLNDDI